MARIKPRPIDNFSVTRKGKMKILTATKAQNGVIRVNLDGGMQLEFPDTNALKDWCETNDNPDLASVRMGIQKFLESDTEATGIATLNNADFELVLTVRNKTVFP